MEIEKEYVHIWTPLELAFAEAHGENPKEEMKENYMKEYPELTEADAEKLAKEKHQRCKDR